MKKPSVTIKSKKHGIYVERWNLIWTEWLLAVIHKFRGPDEDDPHNHNGRSFSIVLKGRGLEYHWADDGKLDRVRILKRGSIVFRNRDQYHTIDVVPGETMTTFFVLIPSRKEWFFLTEHGPVESVEYTKRKLSDKYL